MEYNVAWSPRWLWWILLTLFTQAHRQPFGHLSFFSAKHLGGLSFRRREISISLKIPSLQILQKKPAWKEMEREPFRNKTSLRITGLKFLSFFICLFLIASQNLMLIFLFPHVTLAFCSRWPRVAKCLLIHQGHLCVVYRWRLSEKHQDIGTPCLEGHFLTLSLCCLTFVASTSFWLSRCQVSEMSWPMKLFEEWSSSLTGGKNLKRPTQGREQWRETFWTQVKSVAESVGLNSLLPLVDKGLPYIFNTSYVTKTVLFLFYYYFF